MNADGDIRVSGLRMGICEYMHDMDFRMDVSDRRKAVIRPLRKILRLLEGVEDPRQQGKIVYPLKSLLLMIFVATLGGCENCVQVHDFWTATPKRKVLKKLFGRDDVPSDDTFRRILSLIDSSEVDKVFRKIIREALNTLCRVFHADTGGRRQIDVDGKVMRGTGRKKGTDEEERDIQILNVYDHGSETVLFSQPIGKKRNEIPAAQEILSRMNLKDTIVTFDAMNMQVETVNVIVKQGGDWLGGLKGNQELSESWCEGFFTRRWTETHKGDPRYHIHTAEVAHNRFEERDFYFHVLTSRERKLSFEKWNKVRGLLCCEKHMVDKVSGEESWDTHYYMTSLSDIEDASSAARQHWGCEVEHWFLDTVMKEDEVALTDRQAATNYSILLKSILALYKRIGQMTHDGSKTVSMARIRRMFMFNFDEMMAKMLAMFDEQTLTEALVPAAGKKKA